MDVERVIRHSFDEPVHTYSERDVMRYALSVSACLDPTDCRELRCVYEQGLVALPMMATILCVPFDWGADPALGIDNPRAVYAHQSTFLHRRLPTEGRVRAREQVTAVIDKGVDVGTLITTRRDLMDDQTGELWATLHATALCRGDGGSGATHGKVPDVQAMPLRLPDLVSEVPTRPHQALLYRLNGDLNPIHADPAEARRVGFDRPILHGLCSYGTVGRELTRRWTADDPASLRGLGARFSAPMIPGDTLIVESWKEGTRLLFRALSKERGCKVLDQGVAQFW